jgi:hypothetical protein
MLHQTIPARWTHRGESLSLHQIRSSKSSWRPARHGIVANHALVLRQMGIDHLRLYYLRDFPGVCPQ